MTIQLPEVSEQGSIAAGSRSRMFSDCIDLQHMEVQHVCKTQGPDCR